MRLEHCDTGRCQSACHIFDAWLRLFIDDDVQPISEQGNPLTIHLFLEQIIRPLRFVGHELEQMSLLRGLQTGWSALRHQLSGHE